MPHQIAASDATYFLGFDGGGTKTECILADANGQIVGRAFAGPSNPLRSGYTRAWFALSEAADAVLSRQKISAGHIRGICAGLGGAGQRGVVRRATMFFEQGFPNAEIRVTTDLEIAFEAAFGVGEGIILLAGTGSAAFGRDANGRTARTGGRGPWFSDEGSAFDIGRAAFRSVVDSEEGRGPATTLTEGLFAWHRARDWDALLEHVAKNPDDVFPKTFPLVAELADKSDAVSRTILASAARSLAELVACTAKHLGWRERDVPIAKVGGVHGRSKHFDSAIEEEVKKAVPRVCWVTVTTAPAEAAVHLALRGTRADGHAA